MSIQVNVHDDDDAHRLCLNEFLPTYNSCFVDEIPNKLLPIRGDNDHRIELIQGSFPPNKALYRVFVAQQEEMMTQVNKLLDKGMICPNSPPYCSLVLLVQKKDGSYRMCVDYRAPNKNTIKNRFLVPQIEDIFYKLQESIY